MSKNRQTRHDAVYAFALILAFPSYWFMKQKEKMERYYYAKWAPRDDRMKSYVKELSGKNHVKK